MARIIKYALSGLANTIIGVLTIYALMFFGKINPIASNLIGYGIGLLFSYFLNKNWVFNKKPTRNHVASKYLLAIFSSYILNLIFVFILIEIINIDPYISQGLGAILYAIASYNLLRNFVFKL